MTKHPKMKNPKGPEIEQIPVVRLASYRTTPLQILINKKIHVLELIFFFKFLKRIYETEAFYLFHTIKIELQFLKMICS